MRLSWSALHVPSRIRRALSAHLANQLLVQAIGFVIGLVVVRTLTKEDYALYTLAVSAIAAGIQLSEAGAASFILSARSDRGEPQFTKDLVASSAPWRRVFGGAVLAVVCSILGYNLVANGASLAQVITCVLVACAAILVMADSGLEKAGLRRHQDFRSLRQVALGGAICRLASVIPLLLLHKALLAVALIGTLAGSLFEAVRARVALGSLRRSPTKLGAAWKEKFRWTSRRVGSSTFLIVLQGQLLYLMASTFGNSDVVAEIGALTRFVVLFSIVNVVANDVAAAVFARSSGSRVRRHYGLAVASYSFFVAGVVLGTAIFSSLLVSMLGEQYKGLEVPLVIVAAGSGMINLANVMRSLNHSRGWVSPTWPFGPLLAAWAFCGVALIDFQSILQVSIFLFAQAAPMVITQTWCAARGMGLENRETSQ